MPSDFKYRGCKPSNVAARADAVWDVSEDLGTPLSGAC